MNVIDFRLRPPLKSFLRCGFYNEVGTPFAWHSELPPSVTERSMPKLLDEMKQAGVVKAVVWGRVTHQPERSTINDDVAAIVSEHSDVFAAGFGGICPRTGRIKETIDEIDRCIQKLGLKEKPSSPV